MLTDRRKQPRGETCATCGAKPPAKCDEVIYRLAGVEVVR